MANEKDNEQFGKPDREKEFGQDKQPPTGEKGRQPEFGQQGQQQPAGQQGQKPEFGQQGQASSGQADLGKSGDTDTLSTERGLGQGASGGTEGTGGFVGSQGAGSDAYLREEGKTAGADFASQGQGALEGDEEDIETGQRRNRDSDIEGGSGKI
jgi:translation initiation factor IF-2